jgi:hypothetical protein
MDIIESISGKTPLTVSESALLSPLKSQLSLVGIYSGNEIEKVTKIECLHCTFMDCTCRKKEMYIKN